MRDSKKRHLGMTILEVLLVFIIGIAIFLVSLSQYQSMQLDSDVRQLKYNVDTLFKAAAIYYKANCSEQWDATTGPIPASTTKPGVMDPLVFDTATQLPWVVSIEQLQSQGFLETPNDSSGRALPGTPPFPLSRLIDNSGGPASGYVIQFNLIQPEPKRFDVALKAGTSGTIDMGNIVLWKIQISAKIRVVAKADVYQQLLTADCVSSLGSTGLAGNVTACWNSPTGNTYLVWERLPSMAAPDSTSNLWITNPTVGQFKQMYTTYPMTYTATMADPSAQHFICGS